MYAFHRRGREEEREATVPTGRERGKEGEGGRAEGGGEVLSGACKVGTMEVDHLRTGVSDTLRRGRSFFPSFPCRNLSLSLSFPVCVIRNNHLSSPRIEGWTRIQDRFGVGWKRIKVGDLDFDTIKSENREWGYLERDETREGKQGSSVWSITLITPTD